MKLRTLSLTAIAAFALLQSPTKARADYSCTGGTNTQAVPFAKETLTVSSTAKVLTASVYNNTTTGQKAIQADISVAGDNVRVWFDGSVPTDTVGHLITSGTFLTICSATIPKFQMIRVTSDATVSITYSLAN